MSRTEPEHGPWDNDDDDYRDPWCRDFEGHKALQEYHDWDCGYADEDE